MNTKEFLEILHNPTKLKDEQAFEIEHIIQSFPYFQAARVLQLKSLKNQNSFHYNQTLKKVAAYTTDRNILFQFITSENFYNNQKEAEFIKEIELIDERVISKLNEEIAEVKETILKTEKELEKTKIQLGETSEEEHHTEIPQIIEKEASVEEFIEEIIQEKDIIDKVQLVADNQSFINRIKDQEPDEIEVFIDSDSDIISIDDKTKESETIKTEETSVLNDDDEKPQLSFTESLKKDLAIQESILLKNKEKTTETDALFFEINQKEQIESVEKDSISINEKTETKIDLVFEPAQKEEFKQKNKQEEDLNHEINKPFQFTEEDRFSFNEWLQLSSLKPIDRSTSPKKKKMELIDEFIEKNPKIKPIKKSDTQIDISQPESTENSLLMTETLAQVYTQQKKYDSAIKAYEVLSLKFPEKSGFFADQIRFLEKLKQKQI